MSVGLVVADVVHERTYSTSRVQHAHLETHGSICWRDAHGRIHVRTSTQNVLEFAGRLAGTDPASWSREDGHVANGNAQISPKELSKAGTGAGHHFETMRKAYRSPRTKAFNVQGILLAVNRVTGAVQILRSVHAADIGKPINPMQCRGQIEGAVAMGIGSALTGHMVHSSSGRIVDAALRNYHIPAYADVPRTEVFFADTDDAIGPLAAKSQGECAIGPVAPAIANALANAVGVRFPHLPLMPDRTFAELDAAE